MSAIYMTNITPATVLAGGTLPITVTRRAGCNIISGTNSAILTRPTYYEATANITFTAQTAGDVTIELHKNNVAVPGMTATTTITTADTQVATLSLVGIIRVFCYEGSATLTLVNNSEVDIDVTNISLTVID